MHSTNQQTDRILFNRVTLDALIGPLIILGVGLAYIAIIVGVVVGWHATSWLNTLLTGSALVGIGSFSMGIFLATYVSWRNRKK